MPELTEKELDVINQVLTEEALHVKKFELLAELAQESDVKSQMEHIARKHQGHFNSIYALLG
ncbi:hypothetical protein SAMN02910358_02542 [Lachnospiraceae bacterium XBB1006]|nr:hypothetical protein SAMN02910358_02542 [Lachnospiraceae bacterium XBB1006]